MFKFVSVIFVSVVLSVAQAKTENEPEQVLTLECKGTTSVVNEVDSSSTSRTIKNVSGNQVVKKMPIPKYKDRQKIDIGGGNEYESMSAEADATKDNHKGEHNIFVTDRLIKFDGHYAGSIGPTPVSGQDTYSLTINRANGEWAEIKTSEVNWANGTRIRTNLKITGTCKEVAAKK